MGPLYCTVIILAEDRVVAFVEINRTQAPTIAAATMVNTFVY